MRDGDFEDSARCNSENPRPARYAYRKRISLGGVLSDFE